MFELPTQHLLELVNQQVEINNHNKRFDRESLTQTITYCSNIASSLIDEVLNNSYYPLLHDEDREFIKRLNIEACVINILYPFFYNSDFIRAHQKQCENLVEQLQVEHCLLYLRDPNSIYQNMLNYLKHTFLNLV